MEVGICAILSDFRGRILLQQMGAALRPPHGVLEPGRLPPDALASLVRAQTGLIVWPVRLTCLYYRNGVLTFCWRCTMRGGDLPAPEGQPPAGFFDGAPLPAGLSSPWRQRVEEALRHAGGPPIMRAEAGLTARLGRLLGRAATTGTIWEVTVAVWADVGAEVEPRRGLWQRDTNGLLCLPRATATNEAPWATAARLLRELAPGTQWAAPRLALTQLAGDRPAMTLVFATSTAGGEFHPSAPLVAATAEDPAAPLDPADREMVAALDPTGESPSFRLIPGPGANGNE